MPRVRIPHVFALLTLVIGVFSVLSYAIPSGTFDRAEVTLANGMTRNLVVPGSFTTLDKHVTAWGAVFGGEVPEGQAAPVSLWGFLSAIPRGMEAAADIIFFIFVLGGVFGILRETGTITAALGALTRRFADRGPLLVGIVMVLMGIGGSTLGMGEEFIPLVPIFLVMSERLGYDRMFGLAIVVLSAGIGFAAATTNPFTVAIAQSIAELPLNSALGFRLTFFAVAMATTIAYVLRYGAKVKADPSASLAHDLPDLDLDAQATEPFAARHGLILGSGLAIFGLILYGTQHWHWWMAEMGGGFLLMAYVAAALGRLSLDRTTQAAVKGMEEMVVAALVVGFARGIVVVLEDASILDSLVYFAAAGLDGLPPMVAAQGMLLFQSGLNLFVPSGSGQAAVTMPLMAPLADLLGLTRQTAVFAFTCGDGFSNMVIPTSGSLMAMLLMARVPYERWLRFALPLFLILMGWSMVFLAAAVGMGLA